MESASGATRGMQDIADDCHPQIGEILLVVADREHVEQALGGMRVAAVLRRDPRGCRARDMAGNQVAPAPLLGMADEPNMSRVHGREIGNGVEPGFAPWSGGGTRR